MHIETEFCNHQVFISGIDMNFHKLSRAGKIIDMFGCAEKLKNEENESSFHNLHFANKKFKRNP